VLVNNFGGVRLRLKGFLGTSDDEFEWAMQLNFFTAIRATRAALGPMVEQGGGAIVNTASVNAFFQPDAGTIDYGAAKAALVNLSKSLAQEFGPKGIRVNCVSPGPVATDLWLVPAPGNTFAAVRRSCHNRGERWGRGWSGGQDHRGGGA